MSDKLIIDVRINEYAMRDPNPHVPYSPEEIAAQALECWREGASIIHYHARDPRTGAPSADPTLYAETVRRIREKSDLIVMPTNIPANTVLAPVSSEDRIAPIMEIAKDPATRPELAPIDMTTCNLDVFDPVAKRFKTTEMVYVNTTKSWQVFADSFKSVGIKPVPFLWNVGSIRALEAFLAMRVFQAPLWCEVVLTDGGHLVGHPGTIAGLDAFLDFFPTDAKWNWSVLSFGGNVFAVAAAAMERGGHVSIGLGDHHYQELELPTNAGLVKRVVELARDMGRPTATPAEARGVLGLATSA